MLLVSDLASAVSGTQERTKCHDESDHNHPALCSASDRGRGCSQGQHMTLTKICSPFSLYFPESTVVEWGMLEGTLLPSPSASIFQTRRVLPNVRKSFWSSSLSVQHLSTWKSLFSAVLKISLFTLFSGSLMVMLNKSWSLVYPATDFFPTKAYSWLPIF